MDETRQSRRPSSSPPPAGEAAFEEAEARCLKATRWDELLHLYEGRARARPDAPEAPKWLVRAAEVAREKLGNAPKAERLYGEALLYDSRDVAALEGLRSLHEAFGAHAALAHVLEQLAALAPRGTASDTFCALATVYEQLGRRDRALIALMRAIRGDPSRREPHDRALDALLAMGRFPVAIDLMDVMRSRFGPERLVARYTAVAERLVDAPLDHALALRAADSALQIDPASAAASSAREAIEGYKTAWRERVKSLRIYANSERDRKRTARLHLSIAMAHAVYDGSHEAKRRVKEFLDRAMILWPGMPEALDYLARFAAARDDYRGLEAVFERFASELKERGAVVDVLVRLATLRIERLADRRGALTALLKAHQIDPSRADAAGLALDLLLDEDRAEEAAAILERHLATLSDPRSQVALRLKLGELLESQLANVEAARVQYETVLRLEPTCVEAAQRIIPILETLKHAGRLVEILELTLPAVADRAQRAGRLLRIAQLFAEEVGKPREAVRVLSRALLLDPGHEGLCDALERYGVAAGAFDELLTAYRAAVDNAPEAHRPALLRRMAQLLDFPMARLPEAMETWRRLLEIAPGDASALKAVEDLLARMGDHRELARSYEEKLQGLTDPDERYALLEKVAAMLEGVGGAPERAVATYRQMLDIRPNERPVLSRLAAACAGLGRFDQVAEVEGRLASLSSGDEAEAHLFQRALVIAEHLQEKTEAVEILLALLAKDSKRPGLLAALERLSGLGVSARRIAEAVAPHYLSAGEHVRAAAALEIQLAGTEDPATRMALMGFLARLSEEHLADRHAAFGWNARILKAAPSSPGPRAELERLAEKLSGHAELAALYLSIADGLADPDLALDLRLAGAARAEQAGKTDVAWGAVAAVLGASPGQPEALAIAHRIVRDTERLPEWEQILRLRIAQIGPAGRVSLLQELSLVCERAGKTREAAAAVEDAIAAGGSEDELLPRLSALHGEAKDRGQLKESMARELAAAERAGDVEKIARVRLRQSRLLEGALGDRTAAVAGYAQLLAVRPGDPEALAGLERHLVDPETREAAARALVPAYESAKEHRKLVYALEIVAESSEDVTEKAAALSKAASVHGTALHQQDLAFATLARAVRLCPLDEGLRAVALVAAKASDALDAYAEILSEASAGQGGPAVIPLLRELADLCECGLGDPGRAAAAHARLLEVEPGNVEALRDLHRLYRQMGEDVRLAAVCRQLAGVVEDGAERGALLREAGEILDARLDRPEEAAECFRAVAEASPLDRDAAVVLARLYERLGRPADLAFALELRRAQEGQGPAGREVAYRLAELRRTSLGDGPGALSIFALLLAEDPAHEGVLGSLETWVREGAPGEADAMALLDPALSRLEEHDRRVRLREAQSSRASPPERARLEAEICRLYESDMGQPEMAFVVACRAYARGVEREGFSATMERLASEMTNGLEELADVYEAVASEGPSKAERLPPLRRAAQLRMHLGETERAVALWDSLLADGPGDAEALDALTSLHQKSANARELAEVYRQKASLAEDHEERAQLLLEAARAKKALAEDDSAIELSRAALALRPGHRATLELLDFAYQGVHRPQEHADVLKLLADAFEEGPTRRATLLRRALLLEKEGWGPEAVEAYAAVLAGSRGEASAVGGLERLLEREESRLPAARALEGHYRGVKDGRRLAEVLEVKLPQAEKEERVALLWEVSRLRETLGQRPLAFAAMLRCFHEDPALDKLREELERLAAETGAFDDLAAAYEDELDRGAPEALALTLWRRLGAIYSERLARPDLSARALEEVARRAPHDGAVLSALSRLYRRGNALKELSSVLRRQVDLAADASSRRDLLAELARLCEERLQDRPAAIEAWRGILALDEADHEARAALALLYDDSGRHEELAALLAEEIALADRLGKSERALELAVRLGRLKQSHLADPRGAFSLYISVLGKREAHAGAVSALEEMSAADGPMRAEAALALEPLFAKGSDHTRLVQVLEARAQAASGPEKGALLRRVAELYEGPGQSPEMAFLAATRALEACPDDADTLALCVRTVGPAGAHEELAALIGELLPLSRGDAARAKLSRALAALWEGPLADPVRAAETWRRVIALSPDDAEALAHLEALFREAEDWGELHDVLKRQLALEKAPDARAAQLLRLGDLQNDRLRDTGAAVGTFRRLLELSPEDAQALERLDRLYDRNERWAELSEILLREIAVSAAQGLLEQEIAQKFRLAQLRELKSLDRSGAMALYREILEVRPGHAETVLHLESVVAREPAYDEASEILAAAYRATQSHGKLAHLLDERSAAVAEPERRKQYLSELARIRSQHQERPELAFLALCKAFRDDPADGELRHSLEKAADQSDGHEELAALYEEELHRLDGAPASEVCLKLAQLNEQRLSEPERAIEYYEKARAFDPGKGRLVFPALDRLYKEKQDWPRLLEVLGSLIALSEDDAERCAFLFRLGQVADEKLSPPSPDRAALAYEQILEIDPGHLPAARRLERLYEAAKRGDRLARILELQRERSTGQERERLTARLAEVLGHDLGQVEEAVALYQEILAKNPRSEAAYLALEGLFEDAGRREELIELIRRRLSIIVDPREITRLSDKQGRVLRELGRTDEAIVAFRAALERDPRHRKALEALREIYEGFAPAEELATVLRRLVPLQEDPAAVRRVRLRLAEVLAAMGRREEAVESARRVIDADQKSVEELLRAEELFRSLSAFNDQIKAMELRARLHAAKEEFEQAVSVLFAVAQVISKSLGRTEAAAPIYEKILELAPSSREAFDTLRDIYSAQSDWRRYAAVFEKVLPHVHEPREKVSLLKDLGAVQEGKLRQKDLAFLSFSRALPDAPDDDEVRATLERLAGETGSFEELASVYEAFVDDVDKGPIAEILYVSLAAIHDQKLDDVDAAEAALRKVLAFDPANRQALSALVSMFARRGRHNDHVAALEQQLESAVELSEKKQVALALARVHAEKLESPEDAARALERALSIERDRDTFRALADLLRKTGRADDVAAVLIRARDFEGEPEIRARLQVEISQLYERDLKDDEAAIGGYKLALELDPQCGDALVALEALYVKLDYAAELLGVYDAQLKHADRKERVQILFKSADVWEAKYQNLANVDACLEAVLSVEPRNLKAIEGLERVRLSDAESKRPGVERFEDLLRAYERHLALGPPAEERVSLLVRSAGVYFAELSQIDRAAGLFHEALEIDPRSREAMHGLGLLYERSGNWTFALDLLGREAELLGASAEAVALHYRAGKINQEMLLKVDAAKRCYARALEVSAGHLPSLRALVGIHEEEKDWDLYLARLKQEAEHTPDALEQSAAYLKVARFYLDAREDRDGAANAFEAALKLAPECLDAARPLADIYVAEEDWERADRMLVVVTEKLAGPAEKDPELRIDLARQHYRQGYVREKLANGVGALASYEKSYRLDGTYLPSAEGFAHQLVVVGRDADALEVFQGILERHREEITDLEVVELHWQVGELYRKLARPEPAEKEFARALAMDGHHDPSLRSLVALSEARQDFEAAVEHRRGLLDVLEGAPRVEMLLAIARTAKEKLADPYQAIDAYAQVLKEKADSVEVLDALLALYRETRQPQKAVEVLERLLALPSVASDASRAKRLFHALGETCRDELADVGKAADAFNRALDLDFKFVHAFSALESMLGSAKQWDALEQNYMRMVQRLPKTDETHAVRMTLFKALAELYEKVKNDRKAAKRVYQVVTRGLPDDVGALEKYAELAADDEGSEAEAIEAFRRALPLSASPQRVLSHLVRLFARTKDYDAAYMAAQVVAHLVGEPGPDEREILTKLAPYAKRREQAQKPMTNQMWTGLVYHPKVRGPMGEILALLQDRVGGVFARKPGALGVDPRVHHIDLSTSLEFQLASLKQVRQALDLEAIELYSPYLVHAREKARQKGQAATTAPDRELFVELLHTTPLSLRAGGTLFSEQAPKELTFRLARAMAFARPELALARLLPAERLESVFQAAVVLGLPTFRVTADPREVDTERRALEKLDPSSRQTLSRLAREYAKTATAGDVRNFVEGAELTANRAASLLCTDIEVAKGALSRTAGGAKVPLRAQVRDLMLFAMSREHAELRDALGLKIEIKLPAKSGRS